MYNNTPAALSGAIAGLVLLASLGACGSFGATEDTLDSDAGLGDASVPEGATGDAPPAVDASGPDAKTDGAPEVDGGGSSVPCGSSPQCPAGQGCCLGVSEQACRVATACDGAFAACVAPSDCAGGACCFDESTLTASCHASCGAGQRPVCSVPSDCTMAGGACTPVACTAGSTTIAVVSVCSRAMSTTAERAGVSCKIP